MQKIHKLIILLLSTVGSFASYAATIETVKVIGEHTSHSHDATIILPDSYTKTESYKVIYVLHGANGNNLDWTKNSDIEKLADIHNVIIVNPDAGGNTWYVDSSITGNKYETYLTKDVVKYVDDNYSTIKNRKGRAITGLSMGGIGALNIAINNKKIFGAVGSMSGSVDIRPLSNSSNKIETFGALYENKQAWEDLAIINQLHKITSGNSKYVYNGESNELPLIIDSGVDDFVYSMNKDLHKEMLKLNIQHEFITRPGGHNWDYWNNAIKSQVLFLVNNLN